MKRQKKWLISEEKYPIALRLKLIRISVSVFFILGVLFSFKVWLSTRSFPLIPLFDFVEILQSPFDLAYISMIIILLSIGIFYSSIKSYYIIFPLLLFLLVQDQMRWQPWVYLYMLMLLPFLINQTEHEKPIMLNYLQLIVTGLYFWSGVHKFNPNFIDIIFKNILIDLFKINNQHAIQKLSLLGYCIPVFEISISLTLLIPKTRQLGVWFACFMHLLILLYLSPLGANSNSVVYPWNVAMIFFVITLFWRSTNKPFLLKRGNKISLAALSILSLIWVLPVFNFFHNWDNYLSFSLYSGKIKNYYIAIEESECPKIIKEYNPTFIYLRGITGGKMIDVNKWSSDDLNVPFYAESRVFKKLGKNFCGLGIDNEKLIFLEFDGPIEKGRYNKHTCKDLFLDN